MNLVSSLNSLTNIGPISPPTKDVTNAMPMGPNLPPKPARPVTPPIPPQPCHPKPPPRPALASPTPQSPRARSGGHADRRANFVTLAKENRVFRMGRFAWPFRRAKGPLLYFCRWCPTICAPRGWFYQLFGQDGRHSFALSLGKNGATAQRPRNPPHGTNRPLNQQGPLGTTSSGPVPRFVTHTERPNHPLTIDNPT